MKDSFPHHCDALSGFYQEIGALAISDSALSGGDRWSRRRRPDARAVQTCFGRRSKRSKEASALRRPGTLRHLLGLPTSDRREVVKKHLERVALFEILHERLDGHPRSREHRNAAQDVRVAGDEIFLFRWFRLRSRLYHDLPLPTRRVQCDPPHKGNLFEFLYRRRAIQRV